MVWGAGASLGVVTALSQNTQQNMLRDYTPFFIKAIKIQTNLIMRYKFTLGEADENA